MNLSYQAIQKALNNQWQEAIEINQQILMENPKDVDALNRLAQAFIQIGKVDEAKDLYTQVLQLDRLNPIATRNITKLKHLTPSSLNCSATVIKPFNFIEEHGKTKIISLVRLGERSVLSSLSSCIPLDMHIRCQGICLYFQKKYVGRLPDDIARRLIWLHKRDNKYSVFIKSVEKNKVCVFVKEIKRSFKNKNYPSFQVLDKGENSSFEEESEEI